MSETTELRKGDIIEVYDHRKMRWENAKINQILDNELLTIASTGKLYWPFKDQEGKTWRRKSEQA